LSSHFIIVKSHKIFGPKSALEDQTRLWLIKPHLMRLRSGDMHHLVSELDNSPRP